MLSIFIVYPMGGTMRRRVQRWGNSLALRIPKAFLAETNLDEGSEVDLSLEEGRLIVKPVSAPAYSLDDMLNGISPENLHGETDTGQRTGHEVW
jgi:antitoxin MazE